MLRSLKADPQTCDIPVIMLTMVDDRGMGYALGATDYLTKPIDQDQLRVNLEKPGADVVGIGSAVADDGTVWLVELLAQSNA